MIADETAFAPAGADEIHEALRRRLGSERACDASTREREKTERED